MSMHTWMIPLVGYDCPPLSLNYRMNRWEAARRRAELMDLVHWSAKRQQLPQGLGRVRIELHWRPNTRRPRDTDNPAPTIKACVDALAKGSKKRPGYGLVADDDAAHVESGCVIEEVDPQRLSQLWLTITDLSEARTA